MMYRELKLNSGMFHLYHSGIKLVACTQVLDNYYNSKWYPCRMRHIETIIESVPSLRASRTLIFISFKKNKCRQNCNQIQMLESDLFCSITVRPEKHFVYNIRIENRASLVTIFWDRKEGFFL